MPDDFLAQLAGSWILTGTMGRVALRQRVEARWILQGRYLEVHCVEEGPAGSPPASSPYEALYVIGLDERTGEYTMHLFDTFGAGYARTVGCGTRRGDSIDFLFEYPNGLLSNTFRRDAENDRWEMHLRTRGEDGTWTDFATKTLSRSG